MTNSPSRPQFERCQPFVHPIHDLAGSWAIVNPYPWQEVLNDGEPLSRIRPVDPVDAHISVSERIELGSWPTSVHSPSVRRSTYPPSVPANTVASPAIHASTNSFGPPG